MSIWAILFIVFAIFLVIGPIMMFRPSKRDSQLAALRQVAVNHGVIVRLREITVSGSKRSIAEYLLPFIEQEQHKKGGNWLLLRQDFEHDAHFLDCWDWESNTKTAPSYLQQLLKQQIPHIPENIYGIGASHIGVYLLWNERSQSFDEILERLTSLREMW